MDQSAHISAGFLELTPSDCHHAYASVSKAILVCSSDSYVRRTTFEAQAKLHTGAR